MAVQRSAMRATRRGDGVGPWASLDKVLEAHEVAQRRQNRMEQEERDRRVAEHTRRVAVEELRDAEERVELYNASRARNGRRVKQYVLRPGQFVITNAGTPSEVRTGLLKVFEGASLISFNLPADAADPVVTNIRGKPVLGAEQVITESEQPPAPAPLPAPLVAEEQPAPPPAPAAIEANELSRGEGTVETNERQGAPQVTPALTRSELIATVFALSSACGGIKRLVSLARRHAVLSPLREIADRLAKSDGVRRPKAKRARM